MSSFCSGTPQIRNLDGAPDRTCKTLFIVWRQWRWNRGAARYWGLACRQKGPAPATKYFSGNGVSVASMCAVLH
jgi:hypothetical protein